MRLNKKGVVWLLPAIVIALVAGLGFYGVKKITESNGKPTIAGVAVEKNLAAQEIVNKTISDDKTNQAKIGQQYVAAESVALGYVKSDEPAIKLIKELNPRATVAFNNGLGSLDVIQQDWATQLVLNSLSIEVEKRAIAEQSLKNKDRELQGSILDVKNLNTENIKLQQDNRILTDKLVQEDASAVAFRDKIYWGIGLLVFIVIGLPILSSSFPILKGLTSGLGAIISPFLHKAKQEAENLAQDAVGVVHELEVKAGETGSIAKMDFDKIKSGWISEAHKNVHLYDDVKRKLNLI